MIRRPPRSTRKESSAASDVYKRQYIYILEWTRALNAREVSWIRARVFWAYWLRKTFCQFVVSSCLWSCLLLSCLRLYLLALASLLLCVLLCRVLGLPRAFFGPLLGPIFGLRKAILRLLAAPGALRPSWASSGLLLGSPLAGPRGPWAPLGVTLGGSWVSLGPPLGCSRPLWGRPGGFLGLLWGVLGGSWPLKASFHETL